MNNSSEFSHECSPEYSPDERRTVLRIAHDAILSTLQGREPERVPVSQRLSEPHGAFATLYLENELRGCVGHIAPNTPLHQTVRDAARAAAFEDPRFPAVTIEEATRLKIEISVLSPLQPITPEQIVVGRHGLLISLRGRRGLLLPQVAVEHGWDRETFLEHTCHKAGLPPDAWRQDAKLEAFTAEVFSD